MPGDGTIRGLSVIYVWYRDWGRSGTVYAGRPNAEKGSHLRVPYCIRVVSTEAAQGVGLESTSRSRQLHASSDSLLLVSYPILLILSFVYIRSENHGIIDWRNCIFPSLINEPPQLPPKITLQLKPSQTPLETSFTTSHCGVYSRLYRKQPICRV